MKTTVRMMEPWDWSRTVFLPLTRRMLVLLSFQGMDRAAGIEPASSAWRAAAWPFCQARMEWMLPAGVEPATFRLCNGRSATV